MSIYLSAQVANIQIRDSLFSDTDLYQKTLETLSSGTKFRSSADDPMGFTEASSLKNLIDSNKQALSNVDIGKNLLVVAEGGEENVISNLQRIRELCTQAASGTYSSSEKDAMLKELRQRLDQINTVADKTNFNSINLLDGTATSLKLQVGTSSANVVDVGKALIDVHVSQLGTGTNVDLRIADTVNGANWLLTDIQAYTDKVDSAITQLTGAASLIGSFTNRLDTVADTLTHENENLTEHRSVIADTDTAEASADVVKFQIMQQASINLLVQANQTYSLAFSLLGASSK